MATFADMYAGKVRSLGCHPDKNTINELTRIAADVARTPGAHSGGTAELVVGIVERNLLRSYPDHKLPLVYLMDSILFNVRGVYQGLFSGHLAAIFQSVYNESPSMTKQKMMTTLKRWEERRGSGALDANVLRDIRVRCDPTYEPPPMPLPQEGQASGGFVGRVSDSRPIVIERNQQHQQQAPPPRQPLSRNGNNRTASPPAHVMYTPQQHRAKASALLDELLSQVSPNVKMTLDQLYDDNHELYQQMLAAAHEELSRQPPPQSRAPSRAPSRPHTPASALAMPMPLSAPPVASTFVLNGVPHRPTPTPPLRNSLPPVDLTSLGIPLQTSTMLVDALANNSPVPGNIMASLHATAAQYAASHSRSPVFQQLVSMLVRLDARAPPPSHHQPPPPPPIVSKVVDYSPAGLSNDLRALSIVADMLGQGSGSGPVVDATTNLRFDTQELQSAFSSRQFDQRERMRALKQPRQGAPKSRMWFQSLESWTKGEEQSASQTVSFFGDKPATPAGQAESDDAALDSDANGEQYPGVPVDESQKQCALTGDDFEAYWNEDEEEWMYLNAIRPDPNGPIYLTKAWQAKQAADAQANTPTNGINNAKRPADMQAIPSSKRMKA